MEFLNDLKKNITGTAKDMKRKSEDMIEITKLSVSVGSDEEKLKKMIYELGLETYKSYCENPEESNCTKKCVEISRLEDVIKRSKEKILVLRGTIECGTCHAVVDLDSNFCPKCGAKIDKPDPPVIIENEGDYSNVEQEEP